DRVTQVEQRVWPGESITQRPLRHPDTADPVQFMRSCCWFLIQQAVSPGQTVRSHLSLEIVDLTLIRLWAVCRRQDLQPDRISLQPSQAQHPLQRHGKITAAFAIFRGKAASHENCHASRILIPLACSSAKVRDSEDWLLPEMRSACEDLRLAPLVAKVCIWYRLHESLELWRPSHVELLLQIVSEADQLSLTQERAVHQHSQWLSISANSYWKGQVWIACDCRPGGVG